MDEALDKKLQQNYTAGFTTDVESETLPTERRYNTTDKQQQERMVVAV